MGLEIPIIGPENRRIGRLVAFSGELLDDPSLIGLIFLWRERYREFFFTQFQGTVEKTRSYVKSVLSDPSRRMFFIYSNEDMVPIGHIGAMHLNRMVVDLDNMIRGRDVGTKERLMYWAEISLLRWIFDNFLASKAQCILLGDNTRTVRHHERCGFKTVAKMPLTRWESGGIVHIQPYTDGMIGGELIADGLAQMELTAEEFWRLHGE